jgi:N-acylglucosamine 2-epimerase
MDRTKLTLMKGFYENELINNILPFWLNRSIDEECGGFFSCFDNYGKELISKKNIVGLREDLFGYLRRCP